MAFTASSFRVTEEDWLSETDLTGPHSFFWMFLLLLKELIIIFLFLWLYTYYYFTILLLFTVSPHLVYDLFPLTHFWHLVAKDMQCKVSDMPLPRYKRNWPITCDLSDSWAVLRGAFLFFVGYICSYQSIKSKSHSMQAFSLFFLCVFFCFFFVVVVCLFWFCIGCSFSILIWWSIISWITKNIQNMYVVKTTDLNSIYGNYKVIR